MRNDQGRRVPHRVLEMHYTVGELSAVLKFSKRWVRERIRAGDFGPHVLNINGDLRVPASGVSAFLERFELAGAGSRQRSVKELVAAVKDRMSSPR